MEKKTSLSQLHPGMTGYTQRTLHWQTFHTCSHQAQQVENRPPVPQVRKLALMNFPQHNLACDHKDTAYTPVYQLITISILESSLTLTQSSNAFCDFFWSAKLKMTSLLKRSIIQMNLQIQKGTFLARSQPETPSIIRLVHCHQHQGMLLGAGPLYFGEVPMSLSFSVHLRPFFCIIPLDHTHTSCGSSNFDVHQCSKPRCDIVRLQELIYKDHT